MKKHSMRYLALALAAGLLVAACGGTQTQETSTTAAADVTTTSSGGDETTTSQGQDETTTSQGQSEGDASAPSGTLTVLWPTSAPLTLDSQAYRHRYTQIVHHQMRDKLFHLEPPGLTPQPHVAESIERVDELNWDVHLRQGVLFHNGDELTAEDVAFTFNRVIDQEVSNRFDYGSLPLVDHVTAVDRYVVRFTTKEDVGVLGAEALNLAGQELLHKETYEPLYYDLDALAVLPPMGVGPFKYVNWVEGEYIEMEAFEDYWDGTPGVERIVIRTVPEEATRIAELIAGTADMIYPVSPDFIPQLEAAGMKIASAPGTSLRVLSMNVREGSPFADIEVRRAMNMALDKSVIVDSLFGGYASVGHSLAYEGQEGYEADYQPFSYDPEAAAAVLKQLEGTTIQAITDATAIEQSAVDVIVEQLRNYGITVEVTPLDRAAFVEAANEGAYDLAFQNHAAGSGLFLGTRYYGDWWCGRLPDRINTGFCDEELDALHDAALSASTLEEREALTRQIIRALTEEHVTHVPLYNVDNVWALAPYVNGFTPSSAGQMFDMHKVTLDR